MRVAHFGTFDVDNYGDLLFPLVIEACLGEEIEWTHVSPVGGETGFSDALPSVSVAEAASRDFDAFIVGGGNLIHDGLSAVPRYVEDGQDVSAYPALWVLPALLGAGRPVCWNCPGVGEALRAELHPAVAWTVGQLSYGSVRDRMSAERIAAAGAKVEVGIDSALEMRRLWTGEERRAAQDETLAKGGFPAGSKTVCFHLREWYAEDMDAAGLAAVIDEIAGIADAIPLLLCIGNCHGDDEFARAVAAHLKGDHLVVDEPPTLKHVFSAIACSCAYIGASLHGAITGYSTGIKTLVVAPDGREKFDGFLEQVGGLHWRVDGWGDCIARARELFAAEPDLWQGCYEKQQPRLEAHWKALRAAFDGGGIRGEGVELEVLEKLPPSWCGLHAHLPDITSKDGYVAMLQEQARNGFARARLEEQRLHAELAENQRKLSALRKDHKAGAGPADAMLSRLAKIESAVGDLYKSRRWVIGNVLSGKGFSGRHSGLDNALTKFRKKLESRIK